MSTIGNRIFNLITQQHRSLVDVAGKAEIRPESLGRIIRGDTEKPRRDTIQRIADALGVDIEVLLYESYFEGGESNMGRLDPTGQQSFAGREIAAPPPAPPKPEDVRTLREAYSILDFQRETSSITDEEWSTTRDVIKKVLEQVEGKVK